jgi:hypothetical protein
MSMSTGMNHRTLRQVTPPLIALAMIFRRERVEKIEGKKKGCQQDKQRQPRRR